MSLLSRVKKDCNDFLWPGSLVMIFWVIEKEAEAFLGDVMNDMIPFR